MINNLLTILDSNIELINRVGLPAAWGFSIMGAATSGMTPEHITMYLTWMSLSAATFASIVVAFVNLRKK